MKPSLIALFSLFAFIASSAKAFVIDAEGEPVVNGGTYYILPFINVLGGGLTLAKTGNETCPLSVKPYPSLPIHLEHGLPWKIASPLRIRYLPTNVWVDFFTVDETIPSCVPFPSSWTIVEEEDGVKSVKVSGHGYENTITGVFRIKKYTKIGYTYKIVFCPTDSDSCKDIGLSSRGLVLTDDVPLGVIFVKVESSEVSKQVINNVLEA
ncbi:hypothetical protein QN277_022972 [Acacia crassicarpa]|uniref:Uncharacterized protein n=1 Tax=Acacia crassicarpa TaxID=499986 RepID=A0AAE1MLJ4_9FABA|nr:hypothetical protein QN277_022972 [Acacia crassicarpa]